MATNLSAVEMAVLALPSALDYDGERVKAALDKSGLIPLLPEGSPWRAVFEFVLDCPVIPTSHELNIAAAKRPGLLPQLNNLKAQVSFLRPPDFQTALHAAVSEVTFHLRKQEVLDCANGATNLQDLLDGLHAIQDANPVMPHGIVTMAEAVDETEPMIDQLRNGNVGSVVIPTHIAALDRLLDGGLPRGEVTVFMGPTGTGKSALAQELAWRQGKQGHKILYITLELSRADMVLRMSTRESEQTRRQLLNNTANWEIYDKARLKLKRLPLAFNRARRLTVKSITALYNQAVCEFGGVDVIIIDWPPLFSQEPGAKVDQNVHSRELSYALKDLASNLKDDNGNPAIVAIWDINKEAGQTGRFNHTADDMPYQANYAPANICVLVDPLERINQGHMRQAEAFIAIYNKANENRRPPLSIGDFQIYHRLVIPAKIRHGEGKIANTERLIFLGELTGWACDEDYHPNSEIALSEAERLEDMGGL